MKRRLAVLFDMDGVIVDSMPFHFRAWHQAFASIGVEVSQEEIYLREGEKGEVTAREILEERKIPPREEERQELVRRKREIFRQIVTHELFPGVRELLEELRSRGASLGLVTGTSRKEAERLLPEGFLDQFDVVVTGDDVRQGKPHPEPYLKAVRELGLDPSQCVVIENSPNGIRSAKGAGLRCIALTTSLPREHLGEADRVVDSLTEVREVLSLEISQR
ncbi:MAG: HAD family phosphatase [Nitrospinae bacterium]|nr:HAD family phosphatase [Nitrospinota bacterium]